MKVFSLQWSDFQANVSSAFDSLRQGEELLDITLVSQDQVHHKAHKVVLAASSPFFRSLINKMPHQNPFLFLSGIMSSELQHILDYVYKGETQVKQEDLRAFLEKAAILNIEGLDRKDAPATTLKFEDSESSNISNENIIEERIIDTVQDSISSAKTLSELMSWNGLDGLFYCKVCRMCLSRKPEMDQHVISAHLKGVSHACIECGKVLKSKVLLNSHLKVHKNI